MYGAGGVAILELLSRAKEVGHQQSCMLHIPSISAVPLMAFIVRARANLLRDGQDMRPGPA